MTDEFEEKEEFKELSESRVTLPSSCGITQGLSVDWSSIIEQRILLPSSLAVSMVLSACSEREQLSDGVSFPGRCSNCRLEQNR